MLPKPPRCDEIVELRPLAGTEPDVDVDRRANIGRDQWLE
jgi:hypothetical protein